MHRFLPILLAGLAAGCPPSPPPKDSLVEVTVLRFPLGAGRETALPMPERLSKIGPADAPIRAFLFEPGYCAALASALARAGGEPPRRILESRWISGVAFEIPLADPPASAAPAGIPSDRLRLSVRLRAETLWGGTLRIEAEPRLSTTASGKSPEDQSELPAETRIRAWPRPVAATIPDGGGLLLAAFPLAQDPGAAWVFRFRIETGSLSSDLAPR